MLRVPAGLNIISQGLGHGVVDVLDEETSGWTTLTGTLRLNLAVKRYPEEDRDFYDDDDDDNEEEEDEDCWKLGPVRAVRDALIHRNIQSP